MERICSLAQQRKSIIRKILSNASFMPITIYRHINHFCHDAAKHSLTYMQNIRVRDTLVSSKTNVSLILYHLSKNVSFMTTPHIRLYVILDCAFRRYITTCRIKEYVLTQIPWKCVMSIFHSLSVGVSLL